MVGPDERVLLIVHASGTNEYRVAKEKICVASWASFGVTHAAGEICGDAATRQLGDVDVCDHHYERAQKWIHEQAGEQLGQIDRSDLELDRKRKRTYAEMDAEIDRREAWRKEALKKARSADSIIYYVRRADGLIKIGTSTVFRNRLSQLRVLHGELDVLVTHRGDRGDERELHSQFQIWRAQGEWFHPGRPLVAHIRLARTSQGSRLCANGAVPFGVLESLTKGALTTPPPRKHVPPGQQRSSAGRSEDAVA